MRILHLLILFQSFHSKAQYWPGTSQQALGGVAQNSEELAALFVNPALQANLHSFKMELQLANLYSIPEYSAFHARLAFKNKTAVFGLQGGLTNYSNQNASLALLVASEITGEWKLGILLSLFKEQQHTPSFLTLGSSITLHSDLILHSYLQSPNPLKIAERHDLFFSAGICLQYTLDDRSAMYAEYSLSTEENNTSAGILFHLEKLDLSLGLCFTNASIGSGFIYHSGDHSYSASTSYHPILGHSPSLSYAYSQ